jgi:Phage tail tube protein, GTA-gp10
MTLVNSSRGEVLLFKWKLRPSFENLVAAEAEIGSLFNLIDSAGTGKITLKQMTGLLWHCVEPHDQALTRAEFNATLLQHGLAKITPTFRAVLETILAGG